MPQRIGRAAWPSFLTSAPFGADVGAKAIRRVALKALLLSILCQNPRVRHHAGSTIRVYQLKLLRTNPSLPLTYLVYTSLRRRSSKDPQGFSLQRRTHHGAFLRGLAGV